MPRPDVPNRWADRARNPFRLLPPGPHIIARAAKAGVDTRYRAPIEHWLRTGEVNNTGEVE